MKINVGDKVKVVGANGSEHIFISETRVDDSSYSRESVRDQDGNRYYFDRMSSVEVLEKASDPQIDVEIGEPILVTKHSCARISDDQFYAYRIAGNRLVYWGDTSGLSQVVDDHYVIDWARLVPEVK